MHCLMQKHTGELPPIGVNTFRNPPEDPTPKQIELARSTEEEKQSQLTKLADFHARQPAESPAMLKKLQQAVIGNQNVFAVLINAARWRELDAFVALRARHAAIQWWTMKSTTATVRPASLGGESD